MKVGMVIKLSENSIFGFTSPSFCLTIKLSESRERRQKMGSHMLHYTAPARDWNEALPLGNGKIGMMVFGGVSENRIQLNEETIRQKSAAKH